MGFLYPMRKEKKHDPRYGFKMTNNNVKKWMTNSLNLKILLRVPHVIGVEKAPSL